LGRPSKDTQEFRRDAVDLVRPSGRSINEVAREWGMSHETPRNRVRKHEHQTSGSVPVAAGGGLSVADKDSELQVEKETLRKAAAYFAKEMDGDQPLSVHLRPPRACQPTP
jgi:transposase